MKAVLQKVESAKVMEGDLLISKINKGIVFYIGISKEEADSSIDWLIEEIKQRMDSDDEILLLSQFTLFATFKSGKPSFHRAGLPIEAKEYFYKTVSIIKDHFPGKVQNGIFGRKLEITLNFNIPNAESISN